MPLFDMVADLLFRVSCHGGGDEPLGVHLRRITDSAYTRKSIGGADMSGELVAPVIAESHDEDCRREIMRHLHECLSATGSKHWQRIYGGLVLTEALLLLGSPALLAEVSQGFHFDLVQKVSLLENFDAKARACTDRKAEKVLRKKASELHAMLVSQLKTAEDSHQIASLDGKDTASVCSSGGMSTATPSTAASSSRSSPSSVSSAAEPRSPSKDLHIDDAFSALREWMQSPESKSSSVQSSPKSSAADSELSIDDVEWEPLEECAPTFTNVAALLTPNGDDAHASASRSDGSDGREEFFTPMPAPAIAWSPRRTSALVSL